MEWLEQNIDAYRIVSEILGELRLTVRQRLEQIHGEEWYRKGLPEEVFKRLIAAKEREKSIDWYEGQYQQIMDYAVFADLLEILEHSPEAFSSFTSLAPSTALLNARFLELDVMRAKLGRARPISETELSFLGTFHLRFRKATQEADEGSDVVFSPPEKQEKADVIEPDSEVISPPKVDPVSPPEPSEEIPPPAASSPPQRAVQTDFDDATTTTGEKARSKEESDSEVAATSSTAEDEISANESPDETAEAEEADVSPPPPTEGPADEISKVIGPKKLEEALSSNDHRTVLRELYREVTGIAEGVWSSEVTPAPIVWEKVIASDWYELNFSRLNLQPLSVFYEVTAKVDKKVRGGADKKELQEYLKETNFAKTLLSLRDMFQANSI